MKCPVCKAGLKITNYHNDHIIMESDTECTDCQRYREYFHTGSYEVGVKLDTGWRTWQWSNDTSSQRHSEINLEIARMAKVARYELGLDKSGEIA